MPDQTLGCHQVVVYVLGLPPILVQQLQDLLPRFLRPNAATRSNELTPIERRVPAQIATKAEHLNSLKEGVSGTLTMINNVVNQLILHEPFAEVGVLLPGQIDHVREKNADGRNEVIFAPW